MQELPAECWQAARRMYICPSSSSTSLSDGFTSILPVLEKLEIVKKLTAEKRRDWKSGVEDTVYL